MGEEEGNQEVKAWRQGQAREEGEKEENKKRNKEER